MVFSRPCASDTKCADGKSTLKVVAMFEEEDFGHARQRMGSIHNQFIFDPISVNCVELGQGRFGARSIRACLDNPNTISLQKE